MPSITRTIAKGIAPRLHEPKGKAKARALAQGKEKKARTIKSSKHHKRLASDGSESEENSNGSDSDDSDSEPKKKKKSTKRRRIEESEAEIEIVDEDGEPLVEEVDDVDHSQLSDQQENDGLDARHHGDELQTKPVKKDSTLDLLTMMTDKVTVKFKVAGNKHETETGRWCNTCMTDERFLKLHGKRKAFHLGGNSSCRLHLRQHYNLYKEKCDKAGIPINHWAIPREIWKVMEEEREAEKRGVLTKKQQQQQLTFKKVTGPREFTRAGVLHAVASFIATNNQVSHQQDRQYHNVTNAPIAPRPC
ncbi:hypothetical protein BJ912DRAFT_859601 [Pholiota molesta]|nr:hypothetical protein BJ912DRAFT_859601 [Pholiota molesta]